MSAETIKVTILPDGRLDTANAAAYVGLSVKTMAMFRSRGEGPAFTKRGRVFYFKEELDQWLAEGRAQSTAQARLSRPSRGNCTTADCAPPAPRPE